MRRAVGTIPTNYDYLSNLVVDALGTFHQFRYYFSDIYVYQGYRILFYFIFTTNKSSTLGDPKVPSTVGLSRYYIIFIAVMFNLALLNFVDCHLVLQIKTCHSMLHFRNQPKLL